MNRTLAIILATIAASAIALMIALYSVGSSFAFMGW